MRQIYTITRFNNLMTSYMILHTSHRLFQGLELVLEVFPTVCTNPLRAKSLFAAASPKGDLQVTHRISLKTSFIRLTSNALKSP
jgi:hypothetical protein